MNTDIEILKECARNLGMQVEKISNVLLDDPKFAIWTGSSIHKHHYGKGGLAKHTREVVQLCFANIQTLNLNLNLIEVFFAALFHDSGKMYDYEPSNPEMTEWANTLHKRTIYHVSRSGLIWSHASKLEPEIDVIYHDAVYHAILAHHCERDWGSPVSPYSKVAWLVHICDNLSARMDDCNKTDHLKIKE